MFITFEGVEGCGKSSVLSNVFLRLKNENYQVIETREPGGVKISEAIRAIVLGKEYDTMDKRTEALLFAASRRQHLVEKVWPALKENKIVLCDRFLDSSLAYQGAGDEIGIDEVLKINLFATENTYPDYTILFDLAPEVGLSRINKNKNREVNRLDLKELNFYKTVREAYLALAKRYPNRYIIIDASKNFDTVTNLVYKIIKEKLDGLH
jgi:thymidylate kinase